MSMTRRHVSQAAFADHADGYTNLNNLPAEIILLIAEFLSVIEYRPRPPTRRVYTCPCPVALDPSGKKAKTRKEKTQHVSPDIIDSRLNLASVSKRMRTIVFDNKARRNLPTSFCEGAIVMAARASDTFRNNVSTLRIYTRMHPQVPNDLPLRDFVKLFPNVRNLHVEWRTPLTNATLQGLAPPLATSDPLRSITTLNLNIGGHHHRGFGSAEVTTLIKHMSAPHVEHLSLTLELEDGDYADDRATWQDLADALSSLRYPDLLDFDLCLKIPVDRWRNIEIAARIRELLTAVTSANAIAAVKVTIVYVFETSREVLEDLFLPDGNLAEPYWITTTGVVAMLNSIKERAPALRRFSLSVNAGIRGKEELMKEFVAFQHPQVHPVQHASDTSTAREANGPSPTLPSFAISEDQVIVTSHPENVMDIWGHVFDAQIDAFYDEEERELDAWIERGERDMAVWNEREEIRMNAEMAVWLEQEEQEMNAQMKRDEIELNAEWDAYIEREERGMDEAMNEEMDAWVQLEEEMMNEEFEALIAREQRELELQMNAWSDHSEPDQAEEGWGG